MFSGSNLNMGQYISHFLSPKVRGWLILESDLYSRIYSKFHSSKWTVIQVALTKLSLWFTCAYLQLRNSCLCVSLGINKSHFVNLVKWVVFAQLDCQAEWLHCTWVNVLLPLYSSAKWMLCKNSQKTIRKFAKVQPNWAVQYCRACFG